MSITVTVNMHVLEFPLLSRAVLVTVVVPTENAKPLGGSLVTFITPELSLAVTLKVTLLPHCPGAALTVILAGQVIRGGWVSRTVTVKVHWLLLPLLSRAVFVVDKGGKITYVEYVPEVGQHPSYEKAEAALQAAAA